MGASHRHGRVGGMLRATGRGGKLRGADAIVHIRGEDPWIHDYAPGFGPSPTAKVAYVRPLPANLGALTR